jgi:hypothetical protein
MKDLLAENVIFSSPEKGIVRLDWCGNSTESLFLHYLHKLKSTVETESLFYTIFIELVPDKTNKNCTSMCLSCRWSVCVQPCR